MAVTRTFSIIKPDATRRNLTGAVTKMLEEAGLRVVASKRIHMSREQAEGFYAVHKERRDFDKKDFYANGSNYESVFAPYTQVADVFLNCIYYDKKAPAFFSRFFPSVTMPILPIEFSRKYHAVQMTEYQVPELQIEVVCVFQAIQNLPRVKT